MLDRSAGASTQTECARLFPGRAKSMDDALKPRIYRASLSLLCPLLLAWGGERLWSKHQRDKPTQPQEQERRRF